MRARQYSEISVSSMMGAGTTDKAFRFRAQDADEYAELIFDGIVGDDGAGLDSGSVAAWLNERKNQEIVMTINSPGGYVSDGVAIYNAIARHPMKVTANVVGNASSAASFFPMASDEINIAFNARMHVHKAWAMVIGNELDMENMGEWLGQMDRAIAMTYTQRTGHTVAEMLDIMKGKVDGTNYIGQEAVDAGFADAVIGPANTETPEDGAQNIDEQKQAARANAELQNRLMETRLKQLELNA